MEIKSLNQLKKSGQTYDLYTNIIIDNKKYSIFEFPCTERHDMRIDLVCFDIYESMNDVDLLCIINGIINPLSVQNGDLIFFIEAEKLEEVRTNDSILENIVSNLNKLNKGKEHKIDKNRSNDLLKRKQTEINKTFVPPNILNTSGKNINIKDGKIILKPNF